MIFDTSKTDDQIFIARFFNNEQNETRCSPLTFNVDGFQTTFIPYRSGVINGKGQ